MGNTSRHLETFEETERDCLRGLVNVPLEEGSNRYGYFPRDMTGRHRDYDPCIRRNLATEE